MKPTSFRSVLQPLMCALAFALLAPSCTTVNEHYYPVLTPPAPVKKSTPAPKPVVSKPLPPPVRNPEGFTAVNPYGGTPAGKGASSPDVERNQRSKSEKFETTTGPGAGAKSNN